MDKIINFFSRNIVILLVGISMILLVRTCNTNKKIKIVENKIDSLNILIIKNINHYEFNNDKQLREYDIIQKINNLELAKRILYDNNAIIRTIVRPDDKIHEYDKEILDLRKELKNIIN